MYKIICKKCGNENSVKNGVVRGKQRYRCNDCGLNFVEGDGRSSKVNKAKKALMLLLYGLSKMSFNMFAVIFDMPVSLVYFHIRKMGLAMHEPVVPDGVRNIQFDEMWHFIGSKHNKLWVIKAIDADSGNVIAWVLGKRDKATFKRLYNKVKHLKDCMFYTDDWNFFSLVLPKGRHKIGKEYTVAIEQNNSNTRHHLGRFTRRTKVVSKCKEMVDVSLRIWYHLTSGSLFAKFQGEVLSIFS